MRLNFTASCPCINLKKRRVRLLRSCTAAQKPSLGRKYTNIADLTAKDANQSILFRARVHNSRAQGAKMVFFEFRQQSATIQALIAVEADKVSKQMVKWAERLPRESLVLIEGLVQQPKELVKSTTVQDAEVKIEKVGPPGEVQFGAHILLQIYLAAEVTSELPFVLDDACRPDSAFQQEVSHSAHATHIRLTLGQDSKYVRVELITRLQARAFDLRTPTNQAIFRITSAVGNLFRTHLDAQGFIEIHSPKLQGAATESGASVFNVDYFKRPAFLAQSPQLAKQMCIAGDLGRVYEIGPVFRAEDSNTHRHMTEFTGLDLEMAINEHYHEAMYTLDGMLKAIFRGLQDRFGKEIDLIRRQFPSEPFLWPEETVVLQFPQAVQLLREAGREVGDYEDFKWVPLLRVQWL
jgi:aspartyl/asparaginyl-tRNA synthetase